MYCTILHDMSYSKFQIEIMKNLLMVIVSQVPKHKPQMNGTTNMMVWFGSRSQISKNNITAM